MAIPDYQSLMLPLLKISASGEIRVPDAEEQIAVVFSLTSEERNSLLPSGKQKILHNRMHWAKFYMAKAGLVDIPRRGWFIISKSGRDLLAQNPQRIDVDLLLSYPGFKAFYQGGNSVPDSQNIQIGDTSPTVAAVTVTPEEQIESAYAALQSALRAEILQRILQNSPSFFEQVIVGLLVAMGYGGTHKNAAQQLGGTGDGGVDGVINEDRLGLDRVYIQAKRYGQNTTVGRPDVQTFVGSLVGLGATKGVFVTTSSFSKQAGDFVRHLSQRVILIDGENLANLMIEHNVGVRVSRVVEFKRVDEDFFSEEE